MSKIQVHVFKRSRDPFIEMLDENNIGYSRHIKLSEAPMAAGMSIEVFSAVADASPWGALAICIIVWVNSRSTRKVIITTKDNEIFHAEGYSAKEVESMLEKGKNVAVIDTSPNDET